MREPRRWLDDRHAGFPARLLRTVANEPLPDAALGRAATRFGISAALLSAASTGLANAAASQALGAVPVTSGGSAVMVTLGKAIAVGLGVGAVMVGAAQLAIPPRATTIVPAAQSLGAAGTKSAPASTSVGQMVTQPSGLEATVASAADFGPAKAPSVARFPSRAPAADVTENAQLPVASTPSAVARFSDESGSEGTVAPKPSARPREPETTPPPPPAPRSTLAQEVRVLDSVRIALGRGEARAALDELNQAEHQRLFRTLGREAAVLRVEALGTLGRTEEAATLARQLVAQGVSSSQKKSLKRWLGSSKR
jgi:hypothetical protein